MIAIFLSVASFLLFLFFQVTGIYVGDSGDLVTAIAVNGIPHPPGYPLYTLLGTIFMRIPLLSPAWRVAFLSSIPHALVIGLTYLFVLRMTKTKMAAFFSAVVLLSNYLFFLYAVTPEVFALFDLFFIILLLVGYEIVVERKMGLLPRFMGILGLSLTHHQVILFFTPSLLTIMVPWRKKFLSDIRSQAFPSILLFSMGLIPLLYIPFAAKNDAIINWDRATTLPNFIRLLTRADYGSFVSGGAIGNSFYERLLSVRAFGEFMWTDWRLIGVALILLGFFSLWKRQKKAFFYFGIALIGIGPLFFFYASFPLVNRFLLGTYERFLLPSYVIGAILSGMALREILFFRFPQRWKIIPHESWIRQGTAFMLFLYPMIILGMTVWRFSGIRTDHTPDNLGRDVLTSAPQGSIILLSGDTTLFTTQYVRYALGVRSDTVVIHTSRLAFPEYRESLKKQFPTLHLPKESDEPYLFPFILANTGSRTIMSNTIYSIGKDWVWVPHGLLYELTKLDAAPSIEETRHANAILFSQFSDPRKGIISHYPHLMTEDILDIYAYSHMNLGNTFFRAKDFGSAKDEYAKAAALHGDTSSETAWVKKGAIESALGLCQDALQSFSEAGNQLYSDHTELLLYRSITLRDCLHDATGAAILEREYLEKKHQGETPIR